MIHNDNINFKLIESFENPFFFGVSKQALLRKGFNFDEHIHNELIECFEDGIQYDLIVIPASLSIENYIEFTGLRIAHHIRLTPEFKHIKTPILILSEENPSQIAKISSFANIFFTKGIFHTSTQVPDKLSFEINELKESGLKLLSESDYNSFLDKIKIDPPPNYDNRHSVANEYAMYSWSKAIGLENEKIEKELGSRLYFKYLDCVIQNNHIGPLDISALKIEVKEEVRILLIDDEAEKGWGQFYDKLFGNGIELIVPENDEIDYNAGSKEIKDDVIKLIKSKKPHLVLLDLRLSDTDTGKTSGLTGIEIIKELEKKDEINKGIRIIITSASNKIWNYLDAGIRNSHLLDGVILKSNDRIFDKHPVNTIIDIVKTSIPKAIFLKEVYSLIETIKNLSSGLDESFLDKIPTYLDIAFKLVNDSYTQPKYMNYAYLQAYQVLELFLHSNNILVQNEDETYVFNNKRKIIARKLIKGGLINDQNAFDVRIIALQNILREEQDTEKKKTLQESIDKYEKWKRNENEEFNNNYFYFEPLRCKINDKLVEYSFDVNRIQKSAKGQIFVTSSAKLAVVLAYRYGAVKQKIKDYNEYIRQIRNKKATHDDGSIQEFVTGKEFQYLLEFLKFLFDPESQNDNNEKYALNISKFQTREEKKVKLEKQTTLPPKKSSKRNKNRGNGNTIIGDQLAKLLAEKKDKEK